jgi:hypothetical protein
VIVRTRNGAFVLRGVILCVKAFLVIIFGMYLLYMVCFNLVCYLELFPAIDPVSFVQEIPIVISGVEKEIYMVKIVNSRSIERPTAQPELTPR